MSWRTSCSVEGLSKEAFVERPVRTVEWKGKPGRSSDFDTALIASPSIHAVFVHFVDLAAAVARTKQNDRKRKWKQLNAVKEWTEWKRYCIEGCGGALTRVWDYLCREGSKSRMLRRTNVNVVKINHRIRCINWMGAETSRQVLGDYEDERGRAISLHVLNHTVRLPHGSPREVSSLYRDRRFHSPGSSRGRLSRYLSAGSLLYLRGTRTRSLPALRGRSTRREVLAAAAGFTRIESRVDEGRKCQIMPWIIIYRIRSAYEEHIAQKGKNWIVCKYQDGWER